MSGPQMVQIVTGRPHVIKNINGKCILVHVRVIGNNAAANMSIANRDTQVVRGYQLLVGDYLSIDFSDWKDMWLKTDDAIPIYIDYWVSDEPISTR